jgi:flagellar L-ring protein precursor FlgH
MMECRIKTMAPILLLALTLTGLTACATGKSTQATAHQNPTVGEDLLAVKTDLEEKRAAAYQPPESGSLWSDQSDFGNLFTNPKARRVGDIVTVRIVESSSATNKASTQTGRSSSVSASVDGFLGLENKYSANSPFLIPFQESPAGWRVILTAVEPPSAAAILRPSSRRG